MKRGLSEALEECLVLLEREGATVEECLVRYPEYADDLRPLLEIARQVRRMPQPVGRAAAFAAGKQRMLEALARREKPAPFRRRVWLPRALAFALALVLVTVGGLFLLSRPERGVVQAATLIQAEGIVEVLPAGGDAWREVSAGERLEAGDRVRTGSLSRATLAFFDGSLTGLEAGTEMAILEMNSQQESVAIVLYQESGRTYNRVRPLPGGESCFKIETPAATAAVRGTEFAVVVGPDGSTQVVVVEGVVEVAARQSVVAVGAGQEATVWPDRPPIIARPTLTPSPSQQSPEKPETRSERPRHPTSPQGPDLPEQPEHPSTPERPEQPEHPSTPERPEQPQHPEHPEHPEHPQHPEQPERPERPVHPERSNPPKRP